MVASNRLTYLCLVSLSSFLSLLFLIILTKSDAAGGLLREGSDEWIPIPEEQLECYGYRFEVGYNGCLNGFLTPDGLWVFDVTSDYDDTNDGNACDNIPDCDQFCDRCAGGPIEPGACSADGQYFCFPGDTNDDRWIPHQASCFKCVSGENCCFTKEGRWDFSCPACEGSF